MLDDYRKKITFFIFILILLLMMMSCGVNYHLKKADKHLKIAIQKGASMDTIKKVKYDTIRLESIKDSIVVDHRTDTVKLVEECEELVKSPRNPRTIENIKEIVCPKLLVDTTYVASIRTAEGVYKVPIRIKINSMNGYYAITTSEIKIPYKKEETNLTIKPKTNTWRTVSIILALLLILTILISKRSSLKVLIGHQKQNGKE